MALSHITGIEDSAPPPNRWMEPTVKSVTPLAKMKSKGSATFACGSSKMLGGK
jgi:hypothetical protein